MSDGKSKDPADAKKIEPAASTNEAGEGSEAEVKPRPDPTRYGDWEKNGRCIDF